MIAMRLLAHRRGSSAAEFAFVLPLLIVFLVGMVDAGRFMWEYNKAEKATQMGVRYAVVTNMVASGLASYSFAVDGGLTAGIPVPTSNSGSPASWFASATCNNTSCTCTGKNTFCTNIGYDATAFGKIVNRVQQMYPLARANNVQVEYRNIGLGYSGDPNGPDVAPLVTVRLTGMSFVPITTMLIGRGIVMPDFSAALTLEDGSNNNLTDPVAN